MNILISVQNYLNFKSGIRKFILKYSSSIKGNVFILERELITKCYKINNEEITDIKSKLNELKIDLVHVHSPLDSSLFKGIIDIVKSLNIPVVYFCHSLISEEMEHESKINKLHHIKLKAQQNLFNKADRIIFFNSYQMNRIVSQFSGIKQKSNIIYHGVNPDPSPKKTLKKDKILLYVGRFSKEKGIIELCTAFQKISKIKNNVKLILIGKCGESKLFQDVKSLLKNTNHEIIDWIDDEKELSSYYQEASIVVVPSHYDSFNISAIEAINQNAVLLVSDIPVFKELYLSKNLSFSFHSKSVFSLKSCLIELLNNNKKINQSLPKEYYFKNCISKINKINDLVLSKY